MSIWLRTQGVPNYIHLDQAAGDLCLAAHRPNLSLIPRYLFPRSQVLGFHLAPPEHDPLDYDASELNRMMQPVDVMIGSFLVKAKIRISTQTDVATSLDVMRASWMSIYDADISNPYLPQFSVQVPMLLVNPSHVSFGVQ